EGIMEVCRARIHHDPHHLSADGDFSWEEVECIGACANAPVVQILKDVWEDLTPELFDKILDGYAAGNPPLPGSQIGRKASSPEGAASSLNDADLYDGSKIGSWQAAFAERERAAAEAATKA